MIHNLNHNLALCTFHFNTHTCTQDHYFQAIQQWVSSASVTSGHIQKVSQSSQHSFLCTGSVLPKCMKWSQIFSTVHSQKCHFTRSYWSWDQLLSSQDRSGASLQGAMHVLLCITSSWNTTHRLSTCTAAGYSNKCWYQRLQVSITFTHQALTFVREARVPDISYFIP